MRADEILQAGIDAMAARAAQRDQPTGERSMERAVEIFQAVVGNPQPAMESEFDGWLFMACLKLARAMQGQYCRDDWVDGAAYMALAAEALEQQVKKDNEY